MPMWRRKMRRTKGTPSADGVMGLADELVGIARKPF
jgi:hypothetical protein